jgi:hypothetical protein
MKQEVFLILDFRAEKNVSEFLPGGWLNLEPVTGNHSCQA